MVASILKTYGIDIRQGSVQALEGGLINKTWKVSHAGRHLILQKLNHQIFKDPEAIARNIRLVSEHLKENHPDYLFVSPLKNESNIDLVFDPAFGYFRLLPFVTNSHTLHVVTSPNQAYEAALQFGNFTHLLSGFDSSRLTTTIQDFHNLSLRYFQFESALQHGNPARIAEAKEMVSAVKRNHAIVEKYQSITRNPAVRRRVTHHDTKISNVLFDGNGRGMCVIDLDTVMPGYFISDVGDMMRTYLSPANEEEKDTDKIDVRDEYFTAIVQGYLRSMHHDMTDDEHELIFYAGLFMIYMQALRFLTDHLNDDVYYGAQYEGHNLVRGTNQLVLLERLSEKQALYNKIIRQELKYQVFPGAAITFD